jgi:predicted NUDIX family phosphoesterase
MKNEMILCTIHQITHNGFTTEKLNQSGIFYWFGPRGQLETEPLFRQVCTYTLVKVENKFLLYTRQGSEKRLAALDSIGIGGHVNIGDAVADDDGGLDLYATIAVATGRELCEELNIDTDMKVKIFGIIALHSTDVDKVHVGIVSVLELDAMPTVADQALYNLRLQSIEQLRQNPNLETWSKELVNHLEEF